MSVSLRIKERRDKLGMTQTQLAKAAKLTPAAISQFESGARKPAFDTLSSLADALKVTTDYLLGKKAHMATTIFWRIQRSALCLEASWICPRKIKKH